jgi:subtilisin family serine protease
MKKLLILLSFILIAASPAPQSKTATKVKKPPNVVYLKNWGLFNGVAKSHIDAPKAWNISKAQTKILVAVIDTGLDGSHDDLVPNLWQDSNYKYKFYGWDFTTNMPNPGDSNGHGTHVAGIIGAVLNPINGTSGVAKNITLLPIKFYSDRNPGPVNLSNTVKAIYYAINQGVKIINYSAGGPEFSNEESYAIKAAEKAGVLIVAAAGNERKDVDAASNSYYPASYGTSNVISVAATDINNKLISASNWGKHSVDLAAPGEYIYSTVPSNRHSYMSGTSQATAFVTGVAAMLLSENPKLSPAQIKSIISKSVDPVDSLKDKVISGGRLNAYKAIIYMRESGLFTK